MSEEGSLIVNPKTIIKKLSDETLRQIYAREQQDSQASDANPSRTQIVEKINTMIEEAGVNLLLELLKRDDLRKLADEVGIKFAETDNKSSKAVLSKKLKDKITEAGGIDDFLADSADVKVLKMILGSLEEKGSSSSKDDLVKQVGASIRGLGAEGFWNSFDIPLLHSIAADLKLNQAKNTNSKRKLVESILTNSNPEKSEPKKKKRKITYSKKKKEIEKGITYEDIFQHYNQEAIREYCKKHKLKTSGRKKELINRVLDYLNEDEEEEESKSKKSGSSTKK